MAEQNNKNIYNISDSDFELVQSDQKIFDKALDTKPTTFLKDAFKRFCKNKSSIVGAIIIGILVLLAIVVPVVSTKNIDKPSKTEMLLPPKLFEAGTGFWDGVIEMNRQPYDITTNLPLDVKSPTAVQDMIVDKEPTLINQATKGAFGGYVMFENTNVSPMAKDVYLYSTKYNYNVNDDYKLSISLGSKDDVMSGKITEYAIYLTTVKQEEVYNESSKIYENITILNKEILLKDWSNEYGDITINISDILKENGLTSFEGSIAFVINKKANFTDDANYILISKCVISSSKLNENNESDKNKIALLNEISFDDANKMVLTEKSNEETKIENKGYWACNGRKGLNEAKIIYCDYTYDKYEDIYGQKTATIAKSTLDDYVKAGWCTYTFDPETREFKIEIIDEDLCPIVSVNEITEKNINKKTGKLKDITAQVNKYREMGYDKMPKFLFGTNDSGHDLLKKSFAGLRTSLLLGLCTAAFCFVFGLCWGSISGYFGGNVDLFMERFCEILGGVPWIVIMTLAILHFGSTALTFVMALCLTGWMGTAGRTRTQFYRFKGREYVLASRTLGSSDIRLIFKHVLPNSMGTIITGSVLMITSVIFSEANIAYLNLGLKNIHSFGVMMSENQNYLGTHPVLVLFPAVIISLLMISFNLFGNGLRDAFNPSLKGSE